MRAAGDHRPVDSNPPSPFVEHWLTRLAPTLPPPRRALDVAMGRGRHARLFLLHGLAAFGVDRRLDAVVDAVAASGGLLRGWCADLTRSPLPDSYFDLIVVARYLQRDLFPSLAAALAPGGILLYETFTEAQRQHGTEPRSADHLLEPGELIERTRMLEQMFYEEVEAPEALARLVARRPLSRA
jgi:SAM-dependent methyltransferase